MIPSFYPQARTLCCNFFIFGFAVNFDLCFGTCASLRWRFGVFGFSLTSYKTDFLGRYFLFKVDINI